jgi:hypothetical protein
MILGTTNKITRRVVGTKYFDGNNQQTDALKEFNSVCKQDLTFLTLTWMRRMHASGFLIFFNDF